MPTGCCSPTARWARKCRAVILDIERDFHGHENCTEILCESRPDLVREIHLTYLRAGSDAVTTNSFGGSPITLGEFGIADKAFDLNRRAGELAREAIAEVARDGRTRFVFGSVGPGTRLPSLGHIAYQDLEDALAVQCAGLVAGEVDAFLIETCQDPLQIKAAVNGAKRARSGGRQGHPDHRPGHGRDDRDIAGRRRHRRRGDDHRCAGRAGDRPELRDRAARDGRAPQMARRELARTYLGNAERRFARADRRPDALSADPARAGAVARALCAGGRGRHYRRLLRHRRRAYRRARPDAAPHRARPEAARAEGAQCRLDAVGSFALRPSAAASGKRLSVDRRALQCERLARLPPPAGGGRLGRLRRDGPRAGQGRLAHARCLHRLCRARRDCRNVRGRQPHARRDQRPARHRFDRISGARSRSQALWRQGDHQLDQFRGRRGGGRQASEAREALRRGRDCADDRRAGHGQGSRRQAADRRAAP